MSLDVYLISDKPVQCTIEPEIYIRRNGKTETISVEEWNELHPDQESVIYQPEEVTTDVLYHDNITHNLNKMAMQIDVWNSTLYEVLWRPEEIGIWLPLDLIEPLAIGIQKLLTMPDYYKKYNPKNGWGTYEQLVEFVKNYLNACINYPNTTIKISK